MNLTAFIHYVYEPCVALPTYIIAQNARMLQQKLDQPVSAPPSPRDPQAMIVDGDTANNLVQNIQALKAEVARLQNQLKAAQTERKRLTCLHQF